MHSREHLAALLWPESNPERSHTNLRNSLAYLIITPNQTTFDLSCENGRLPCQEDWEAVIPHLLPATGIIDEIV